jgi:DNA-binding ferritin-like protein
MAKPNTFKTKNTLPEKIRNQSIALLNRNLASAIDLKAQAKQAHWNVKGPDFIALHELFDKVADEADGFVDLIAERVTALGGTAEGIVQGRGRAHEPGAVSDQHRLRTRPRRRVVGRARQIRQGGA